MYFYFVRVLVNLYQQFSKYGPDTLSHGWSMREKHFHYNTSFFFFALSSYEYIAAVFRSEHVMSPQTKYTRKYEISQTINRL